MKNSKNVIITRIDGSIKKIRLPNPQIISEGFFTERDQIVKIEIPEGVQIIDSYAFECCDKLETVIFPQSLVRINKHAFYECKCLIDVKYSENVVAEEMAFYGCTSLLIQK